MGKHLVKRLLVAARRKYVSKLEVDGTHSGSSEIAVFVKNGVEAYLLLRGMQLWTTPFVTRTETLKHEMF